MAFSDQEKTRLFDKLEEHSVCLGRIEERLRSGDEKFKGISKRHENFQDVKEKFQTHIERHRVFRLIIGGLATLVGSVAGLWRALK